MDKGYNNNWSPIHLTHQWTVKSVFGIKGLSFLMSLLWQVSFVGHYSAFSVRHLVTVTACLQCCDRYIPQCPNTYLLGARNPSEKDGWLFNRSGLYHTSTECFDTMTSCGHSVGSELLKWTEIWYGIKGPIRPQVTDNSSHSSAALLWWGGERKADMAWNPERGIHLAASTLWLQPRHRPLIFPLAAGIEEPLPKPTWLMMFKNEQWW